VSDEVWVGVELGGEVQGDEREEPAVGQGEEGLEFDRGGEWDVEEADGVEG
jgi:hypothetical protein